MPFKQKTWLLTGLSTLLAVFLVPAAINAAEPYRIVGFGDSLMAGYQLGPEEGFTARLAAALGQRGHNVQIINAGVSGDTSSGGLARLKWSIPENTDLVILELGANDALRGIPPKITEANLDRMISELLADNIDILLAGMLGPPNMGDGYVNEFNAIYPRLAERHGVRLYPFFLDGVAAEPEYLLPDKMHPNPRGVDEIVSRILPHVEDMIETDPDTAR